MTDSDKSFCEHFIEGAGDPWGGTYCKLLAGHGGPHSAHYPPPVWKVIRLEPDDPELPRQPAIEYQPEDFG